MTRVRERTPIGTKKRSTEKKKTPLQGLPAGGETQVEMSRAIEVHRQRREGCLSEQERLRKELWALLPTEKTSYRLLDLQERMEQQGQWAETLARKQRDLERALWRMQNAGLPLPTEKEEREPDERASAG